MEVAFYRRVADESDALMSVMPTLLRVEDNVSPRALILEDVSNLVISPLPAAAGGDAVSAHEICVMDIKLGYRSFKQNVSNEPKRSYFEKYMQFKDDLSPTRVLKVWASLDFLPSGPTSLALGVLGKRFVFFPFCFAFIPTNR